MITVLCDDDIQFAGYRFYCNGAEQMRLVYIQYVTNIRTYQENSG